MLYKYIFCRFCFSKYKHPIELFVEEIDSAIPKAIEEEFGITASIKSQLKKEKIINFDTMFASMKVYTQSIESEERVFPLKWFKRQSHVSLSILRALACYMYMHEIDKNTLRVFNILKEKAFRRREEKS